MCDDYVIQWGVSVYFNFCFGLLIDCLKVIGRFFVMWYISGYFFFGRLFLMAQVEEVFLKWSFGFVIFRYLFGSDVLGQWVDWVFVMKNLGECFIVGINGNLKLIVVQGDWCVFCYWIFFCFFSIWSVVVQSKYCQVDV